MDVCKLFLLDKITPTWHAMGTVKMGKQNDSMACVSSDCRVLGVSNLRVADMSVCPVVPRCVNIDNKWILILIALFIATILSPLRTLLEK
jgi:choline dehydrogenase-like flavoprotein